MSKEPCRTCSTTSTKNLYEFTTQTENYPEKILADLILELANINVNTEDSDKLPHMMCETCVEELKNAYHFVRQVQQRHEKLMAGLRERTDENYDQVLMTIKKEEEFYEELNTELLETSFVEHGTDTDMQSTLDPLTMSQTKSPELKSGSVAEDNMSNDDLDDIPLQRRKKVLAPASKQHQESEKAFKCDKCNKSYYWEQSLKHHLRKHLNRTEWFQCSHCTRKFYRKDALQAHMRTHEDAKVEPKRLRKRCEKRFYQTIDPNLCKPHGCKEIQCMICLEKLPKIKNLRRHLLTHEKTVSFAERDPEKLRDIIETLYPNLKNATAQHLEAQIRADLNASRYERFASITNEFSYELSLDSSETESEIEMQEEQLDCNEKPTYGCELCGASYRRKYELFEHQRQMHKWQEAPHSCVRCGARFVSKQMLNHHYKSQCKNMSKRFMCKKCPLRFSWKHNLKLHYRSHREQFDTLECTECDRFFESKKSLTVHMRIDHADISNLVACQWCDRKFYRRDLYEKHLNRHGFTVLDLPLAETQLAATTKAHGTKYIDCKVCDLQFARITDLRAHLLLELKLGLTQHQSYDSFINYSIRNVSGYELHIDDSETDDEIPYRSNHKVSNVYTCELCQVQCRRKFELMRHQYSIHRFDKLPYACELCIFKTVSQPLLEYHRITQCLNSAKKYACTKCGYKFMWLENLRTHMLLQHSIEDSLQENDNGSEPIGNTAAGSETLTKTLPCPHCDRSFVHSGRLRNHIRDVHSEGEWRKKQKTPNKFLCSHCGKALKSAADLVVHVRRHTGEKPYKCESCDMAFARHCDLTGHRRKHTGEKPFHCTVCSKDFARSDKLKRHMLTHSGLKPYKCTYCSESFRYTQHLKQHLQQHMGEFLFECSICSERFLQSRALHTHRMIRGHFEDIQ